MIDVTAIRAFACAATVLLVALAVLPATAADGLPRPSSPVRLEYEVFYGDFRKGNRVAEITQQFESTGDGYRIRAEGTATGVLALVWRGKLRQTSEGRLDARGFVPTRYEEQRGNRSPRGARIDRDTGQAQFLNGGTAEAPAGTQDRLSVLGQLGLLIAAARPADAPLHALASRSFEMPLLSSSKVKPSIWQVGGVEQLPLGGAAVDTVRVRRVVAAGSDDPVIEAWFDPYHTPWPIRVRVTEADGSALDQLLQPAKKEAVP